MHIKDSISQLGKVQPWDCHTQELECVMVLNDTHNVRTFCFQTENASWFRYTPGQFITLALEIDGEDVHRTYTLSSTPSRPTCISITVKAIEGGIVSNWLHNNLGVGDKIRAVGPAGLFTLDNHIADKYLFLAGGVGITPMLSMTRWLFDYGRSPDLIMIQSSQMPSDLIARRELETLADRLPGIRLAWVCNRADENEAWTGYTGRLDASMLEIIAPDYLEREIFCCGPEPYMNAVKDILGASSFDIAHYHEESFTMPDIIDPEPDSVDSLVLENEEARKVMFTRSGKEVTCDGNETVMDAANKAGLSIPNACLFGMCGTCKVMKQSGDVNLMQNGGISQSDIDEGYILACCSKPLNDIEIDY